jgi:hypothetical protein
MENVEIRWMKSGGITRLSSGAYNRNTPELLGRQILVPSHVWLGQQAASGV